MKKESRKNRLERLGNFSLYKKSCARYISTLIENISNTQEMTDPFNFMPHVFGVDTLGISRYYKGRTLWDMNTICLLCRNSKSHRGLSVCSPRLKFNRNENRVIYTIVWRDEQTKNFHYTRRRTCLWCRSTPCTPSFILLGCITI